MYLSMYFRQRGKSQRGYFDKLFKHLYYNPNNRRNVQSQIFEQIKFFNSSSVMTSCCKLQSFMRFGNDFLFKMIRNFEVQHVLFKVTCKTSLENGKSKRLKEKANYRTRYIWSQRDRHYYLIILPQLWISVCIYPPSRFSPFASH